jgi:thiopeptide-type bacteriocin biosynthesis protein
LRSPLLPLETLETLHAGLSTPEAAEDELEAALPADRGEMRRRLSALFASPEIREAIFLASPTLIESLARWERDPEREPAAELSLLRYVTRMATRPTPFGLFAGYSVGRLGETTRFELAPRARQRRRSRLDMEYVVAFGAAVERNASGRAELTYRPNTSLYQAGDRLRYVEDRREGRKRTYHLVAADPSGPLLDTIARARTGATVEALARALVSPTITESDAQGFVSALVERRILVSDLEPTLTGTDAADALLAELERSSVDPHAATILREARDDLRDIDIRHEPSGAERYRNVAARLARFPVDTELRGLFQIDLEKPFVEGTLGTDAVRELERAVSLLHRITPRQGDPLAEFIRAFTERYESEEVPLVEALDEEIGIGFAVAGASGVEESPLLAGLPFPSTRTADGATLSRRDVALLRLLDHCIRERRTILSLCAADVETLSVSDALPLPDAFAVWTTVLVGSPGERPLIVAPGSVGPSGARMLGRFCSGDAALEHAVRAHLAAEEALRPDAVFAEIVCHPEDRVGNVLARPVLRGYEIPYLGRSGAPPSQQILVTDLRVRISGGRVVLRSERLDREVVPRLSTAHFYSAPSNTGVYRFLASLQNQGVMSGLSWTWGACEHAPFLPRVVFENLVLSRARWQLTKDEVTAVRGSTGAARHRALRKLRGRRGLPRWVVLSESDNELVVDLENPVAVDGFLERARSGATVTEWYPGAHDGVARSEEGTFAHEILVPFVRKRATQSAMAAAAPSRAKETPRASRTFPPGSEWLYVKLYGGEASVDAVLAEVVAPLRAAAFESGAADRWFFIRYGDPENHLRVRFHGDPSRLAGELLPEINARVAPFLASRVLHRVELGTYQREVERYGGLSGVELSEGVFHADSDAALELSMAYAGDGGSDARWRVALVGLDALLGDFGLDIGARLSLATRMRDGFAKDLHAGSALRDELRDRFRRERASIASLLESGPEAVPEPVRALFARRSVAIAPIVRALSECRAEGALSCEVAELVPSYTHLWVNRVLRASHLAHEFVLYEFLAAHYRSVEGRARAKPRTASAT